MLFAPSGIGWDEILGSVLTFSQGMNSQGGGGSDITDKLLGSLLRMKWVNASAYHSSLSNRCKSTYN
jgi:hypothetical protein